MPGTGVRATIHISLLANPWNIFQGSAVIVRLDICSVHRSRTERLVPLYSPLFPRESTNFRLLVESPSQSMMGLAEWDHVLISNRKSFPGDVILVSIYLRDLRDCLFFYFFYVSISRTAQQIRTRSRSDIN